jgi:hypothetical protein
VNKLTATVRRPGFWLVATAVLGTTGLALGNGWITGATLLTILIAAAPCLVMCALGLCMKGEGEGICKQGGKDATPLPIERTGDIDSR